MPDEVVDSLLGAVRTTGVDYCKRYYALKKSILKETQGLETFGWSDRNAAIDIGTASDTYTWPEAVDIVRAGYEKFSPTMADLFTQMVDEKRIDVPAANGKRGGAYCSSAYGVGPFQLLNFTARCATSRRSRTSPATARTSCCRTSKAFCSSTRR